MYLHHRLRRIERSHVLDGDGLRPCLVCKSGDNKRVVVQFEDQDQTEPLPTCPACGRTIAFVVNIRRAVPPPGWSPTP